MHNFTHQHRSLCMGVSENVLFYALNCTLAELTSNSAWRTSFEETQYVLCIASVRYNAHKLLHDSHGCVPEVASFLWSLLFSLRQRTKSLRARRNPTASL